MPTDKPRFTITMDDDLYRRIEDFKFKHRYKNQTQAVLALIDMGIASLETKASVERESIEADEFSKFETFIGELGYSTRAENGYYRLCKGKRSVKITVDELRTLARTSKATVGALVKEMMDREKAVGDS